MCSYFLRLDETVYFNPTGMKLEKTIEQFKKRADIDLKDKVRQSLCLSV